ncbi:hypothetical protein OF377_01600 [Ureaplasma sp. ES3154-GEN]|uniref:hypothetical protein n=1 Tax=Ureaplasma sp. ES3154-GEN TaxID=2984844 RepID=UPI0021E6DF40|nr:hypothetical protein [Ureaplasma sp. ES3154-GEN]MCV3743581.1 hypothetical protein [Ureaplasma sp. ES3154-GEN]
MTKKKQKIWWSVLGVAITVPAAVALAASCSKKTKAFDEIVDDFNNLFNNATTTQKEVLSELKAKFDGLKKEYESISDEARKDAILKEIQTLINNIQARAGGNSDHISANQPGKGEIVNNTEKDERFRDKTNNNKGTKWTERKNIAPNQVLEGKTLNLDEDYEGLMIFNWTAAEDSHGTGESHTHSHTIQEYETKRIPNNQREYKIIDGQDLYVNKVTGRLNNILLRVRDIPGIGSQGWQKIQLRFDGIGVSSDSVPPGKLKKDIDNLYMPYQMNFKLPVDYLKDKDAIRITAISLQHLHGDSVGDQWTIQFTKPIVIPVR